MTTPDTTPTPDSAPTPTPARRTIPVPTMGDKYRSAYKTHMITHAILYGAVSIAFMFVHPVAGLLGLFVVGPWQLAKESGKAKKKLAKKYAVEKTFNAAVSDPDTQ